MKQQLLSGGVATLFLLLSCLCGVVNGQNDQLKILIRPQNQTVAYGGIVTFYCTATGNPQPQIEWRKNGRLLGRFRYVTIGITNGSALRIEPLRNRDDGKYACVAHRGGDAVSAEIFLTVLDENNLPRGFPRVEQHPQLKVVERGRDAVIQCQITGNPTPSITWLKDFIPVDMKNPRYNILKESSLQIRETDKNDQGKYECVGENSLGTVYSFVGALHIRVRRVPPHFSIRPMPSYEVTPGSNLNITCVAVGSPMPLVKWRSGLEEITPEDRTTVGWNILQLQNIEKSANYTCIASSSLGSINTISQVIVAVNCTSCPRYGNEDTITITPKREKDVNVKSKHLPMEPGNAPRNVIARPLCSTSIVVRWDEPAELTGEVTSYKVYYTNNFSQPFTHWNSQTVGNNKLTTISDLSPRTTYTIRVHAYTNFEYGPSSKIVQVKTQQGVPTQPIDLRVVSKSPTSVQLTWMRPAYVGRTIIGYELYWNDTFTKNPSNKSIPATENYVLAGLHPHTLHHVWLAARTRYGEGPATFPISVKTEEFVPSGSPMKVRVKFKSPTTLAVTWEPPLPDQRKGEIILYQVQLHEKIDIKSSTEQNTTELEIILDHLKENIDYIFRVKAFTSIGGGPYSERFEIRPSPPPLWVKSVATSDCTCYVWWEPVVSKPNIIGYRIYYAMIPVVVIDKWEYKDVDLTNSTELTNLKLKHQYVIRVAARSDKMVGVPSATAMVKMFPDEVPNNFQVRSITTHSVTLTWRNPIRLDPVKYKISYGALKEYVDSQLVLQQLIIPAHAIFVESDTFAYTITDLYPFITYRINLTAVPSDESYRPPVHITVTTAMAAPQPMVKPDFYGVLTETNVSVITVLLPRASEEFGPISHYYLVVVLHDKLTKHPDQFSLEELTTDSIDSPYIAAKFLYGSIPFSFLLGDGKSYEGFTNKHLEQSKSYKIFVRAVVDNGRNNLYTSSPFSDPLSLDSTVIEVAKK